MKKKILMGILLVITFSIGACGSNTEKTESSDLATAIATWQEQYDLGMQYLEDGDYEQAIVAFTAAIHIDPNRAEAYQNRAYAYMGNSQTWKNMLSALEDYEKTLELDEYNVDAYLGLVELYIRQEKFDQAKKVLQDADEKLDDERIDEKLKELNSGEIYNQRGQLLYRCGYDERGNRAWYHILSYDSDGRQTGIRSYNANGEETGYVEYLYDEKGRIIQDAGYSANGTISKVTYEYDEEGNVVQSYEDEEDIEFSYDAQGNVIEQRWPGENGLVMTFTYNEQGQNIRTDEYKGDEYLGYTIYEYDERGNQISENTYNSANELTEKVVMEWDENGNMLSENIYDSNDALLSTGSEW